MATLLAAYSFATPIEAEAPKVARILTSGRNRVHCAICVSRFPGWPDWVRETRMKWRWLNPPFSLDAQLRLGLQRLTLLLKEAPNPSHRTRAMGMKLQTKRHKISALHTLLYI